MEDVVICDLFPRVGVFCSSVPPPPLIRVLLLATLLFCRTNVTPLAKIPPPWLPLEFPSISLKAMEIEEALLKQAMAPPTCPALLLAKWVLETDRVLHPRLAKHP